MLFEELVESFIYSRKNGVSGAKGVARPHTLRHYEWGLKQFTDFMQDKRKRNNYEDIVRNDMRAFVEHVHNNPGWKSKATRYDILRCVRAFMHFIEKDPDCQEAQIKSHVGLLGVIPKNTARSSIPSLRSVKDFRSHFDTNTHYGLRNYALFNLILGTGLRSGEVRHLRISDVHLEEGMIHVSDEGKTGSRMVPADTTLVGILKAWLRRRSKTKHAKESPWMFPAKNGDQLKESAIIQVFSKIQNGVNKADRITPHTLRHIFGTHYLAKSKNMERTRMILGHKSYETMKIYLHLGDVGGDESKAEMETASPLKSVNALR